MKKVIVIALAIGLGGCVTAVRNPISKTQIYNLENSYGVVQSLAAGYASEPFCPNGTSITQSILKFCAIPSAVVAIGKADIKARSALREAQQFVTSNPTLDAGALIDAARIAIDAARVIETSYGLK